MTPHRLSLICAAALLVAGCGGGHHRSSSALGSRAVGVQQLASLGQLKDDFNAHAGEPRLIVLLSPT